MAKAHRLSLLDPLAVQPGPPTEQETLFVEHMSNALISPQEAAALAGYPDPANAVPQLYCRPEVMQMLVAKLVSVSLPWRALLAKSKAVLFQALLSDDVRVRVDAAKTLLMAMKGTAATFSDAADVEDKRDRETLIAEVLALEQKSGRVVDAEVIEVITH